MAVTASEIDIAYAHLALAFSENSDIRQFAETMIRDHSAVNEQVFALAQKLGVTAQDNDMSRQLLAQAQDIKDELSGLRGKDFDRRYTANEAAYHRMVNGVVANEFIPNVQNDEVLLVKDLVLFGAAMTMAAEAGVAAAARDSQSVKATGRPYVPKAA